MRQTPITIMAVLGLTAGVFAAPAEAAPSRGVCDLGRFESWLTQLKAAKGHVTLTVQPNRTKWKVGESAKIRVQSSVSGRLLLMTIDAKNNVFPIYPSETTGMTDEIEANRPVVLPHDDSYTFRVDPPVGKSRLIAIVRPDGVPSFALGCTKALTKGRSVKLERKKKVDPFSGPSRSKDEWEGFALAEFRYTVVPRP